LVKFFIGQEFERIRGRAKAMPKSWRAFAILSVLAACVTAHSSVEIVDATVKFKEFEVVRLIKKY
jgi:hypothetical protein